jgi:hypothetical protein
MKNAEVKFDEGVGLWIASVGTFRAGGLSEREAVFRLEMLCRETLEKTHTLQTENQPA